LTFHEIDFILYQTKNQPLALAETTTFKKEDPNHPDPLIFLRNHPERDTPEFKNYLRFFETLGTSFKTVPMVIIPVENHSVLEEHIKTGECHTNTTNFVFNAKDHKFMYGFVDSYIVNYNETAYIETYQHSFTLVHDKQGPLICDPTLSMVNIRRTGELLESFLTPKNFFGVYVPTDILSSIVIDGIEETPLINISWYFKENVFISDTHTDDWIQKLLPHQKPLD
jgi:hypothetical protein